MVREILTKIASVFKISLLPICNGQLYLNLLGILTLENIYKFKVALFTHKITNNTTNIPNIFKGTLTLPSEVHSYNTRFVSNLNFHWLRMMIIIMELPLLHLQGLKFGKKIPSKL